MARGLVSVNERSEDVGPFLETANEERVAHVQLRSIEKNTFHQIEHLLINHYLSLLRCISSTWE